MGACHGVVRLLEHEFEAVHPKFCLPNPLFSRTLLEVLATACAFLLLVRDRVLLFAAEPRD